VETISDERLADLGYISAARVQKEQEERIYLAEFLEELALKIASQGKSAVSTYSERRRRKVGSLLRKFDSILQHDCLYVPDAGVDSEALGLAERSELQRIVESEAKGEDAEVDSTTDHQALLSQVLKLRLGAHGMPALLRAVRDHWADFDLYGEAIRIDDPDERARYRSWLDRVVRSGSEEEPQGYRIKSWIISIS
jgi:hypothetical protein